MPALTTAAPLPLADAISREFLLHHRVCPRGVAADGALRVAAAPDAHLDAALDDLAVAYRRPPVVEPVSAEELERLIERLSTGAERLLDLERAGDDAAGGPATRAATARARPTSATSSPSRRSCAT